MIKSGLQIKTRKDENICSLTCQFLTFPDLLWKPVCCKIYGPLDDRYKGDDLIVKRSPKCIKDAIQIIY